MNKEIELSGKHTAKMGRYPIPEFILCTIVIDQVNKGFGGTHEDPAYDDSADYHVEGIGDIHEELYKDEILHEVTCMLAERSEALEDYWDEDKHEDDEYLYFNEDGDSPF